MMSFIFNLFLVLDAFNKFHEFHRSLEKLCCGHGQTVIGIALPFFGFSCYIMLEVLSMFKGDGPIALFITMYVFYYMTLVLMFLAWMVYWDLFAFYCVEYSYMHGFM